MSEPTDLQVLTLERRDQLAIVTLDRPQVLNALNHQMLRDLIAVAGWLKESREVGAVLLRGNGRAFCAGGDIKDLEGAASADTHPVDRATNIRAWGRLFAALYRLPLPLVVAVQGYAVGAGCCLAAMGDHVLAAEDAQFALLFIQRGLVADFGGLYVLPRRLRPQRARDLLYSGRAVAAQEAVSLGLADEVVPGEELERRSLEVAGRLAQGPPQRLVKHLLLHSLQQDFARNLVAERADWGESEG